MRSRWIRRMIMLLLLGAAVIFLLPEAERIRVDWQNSRDIRAFREIAVQAGTTQMPGPLPEQEESEETQAEELYGRLLAEMERYNESIYLQNQAGLSDAWDAQDASFDFSLLEELGDQLGYLTIEAMDLEIPLYMGANRENLAKGAAVLSQTSLPVGGVNTNCVIAGHRGYYGAPMFAAIEKLQPGDRVVVTNLWGDMIYSVVKCIVISPDEIDAVKIVEGQDMLTLVTCHPYGHNYQRYVVYCIREDSSEPETPEIPAQDTGVEQTVLPSGQTYQSSQTAVERDFILNRIGAAAALLLLGGMVAKTIWRIRTDRRQRGGE